MLLTGILRIWPWRIDGLHLADLAVEARFFFCTLSCSTICCRIIIKGGIVAVSHAYSNREGNPFILTRREGGVKQV
jgi:hypothetical protein